MREYIVIRKEGHYFDIGEIIIASKNVYLDPSKTYLCRPKTNDKWSSSYFQFVPGTHLKAIKFNLPKNVDVL